MNSPKHNRTPRGASNAESPRTESPNRPIQTSEHAPVRKVL